MLATPLVRRNLPPGRTLPLAAIAFTMAGCVAADSGPTLRADTAPLHLEAHLAEAAVQGSEVPADAPEPVSWQFDEILSDWKPAPPSNPEVDPATLALAEDALRLTVTEETRNSNGDPSGGIYLEVPGWDPQDWAHVLVRARSTGGVESFGVRFNLREEGGEAPPFMGPFQRLGEVAEVVDDGTVQSYLLRLDWSGGQSFEEWEALGLWFIAEEEPGSIDILSIQLLPKEAGYVDAGHGVRSEVRERVYRNSLFTHAPGKVEYQLAVPTGGHLDVGLGVLRDDVPVTFRVVVTAGGSEPAVLFEEAYSGAERWGQRTIDLSAFAGRTVTLALETESDRAGAVALWGSPTVSGSGRSADRPNVVFYVIDGAAADFMSVYGYARRTTPNMEALAAEGVVFERVYSNASWTKPSTASFMTGLQHSALGGLNWMDPVPADAPTMAQMMHSAGYQTGVFVANPNAGTLSGLHRDVDFFRETWEEFTYFGGEKHAESSRFLHEGFFRWREAYPGEPYWVHFQTTDVHEDFPAAAPFSGLYVGPDQLTTWREWQDSLQPLGDHGVYSEAWEASGLDRQKFFAIHQALYDETMAHNDYQLGRLVDRLKAEGTWENTLLVIGGDHSTDAAMDDMGVAVQDSLPPRWSDPMLRSTITRVPLIFVWPGRLPAGQRFAEPVSMIDVLPTMLDLLDLPGPEVAMGQSLAPLMLGQPGWEPRPVILDEFVLDKETGDYRGRIEMVDGRWGASLQINADPEQPEEQRRPVPLLLYDLWNDPYSLWSVHEEHPDLVEKYTELLERQFEAHMALAQRFTSGGETLLTAEQLQTLRSLGYIN
jgi:arylsulfatase A-like enzyme